MKITIIIFTLVLIVAVLLYYKNTKQVPMPQVVNPVPVTNEQPVEEDKDLENIFTLNYKEEINIEGLSVYLDEIAYEQIAADPHDRQSYPAGSGANAYLKLELGSERTAITLNQLSRGYTSHDQEEWQGYTLKLIEFGEDSIKLKIFKN